MKLVDLLNLVNPDTWVKIIDLTHVKFYGAAEPDRLYESVAFRNYVVTAEVASVYPDTTDCGGMSILVIECR